jgi:membrane fusion protein (multidrug efflux system)
LNNNKKYNVMRNIVLIVTLALFFTGCKNNHPVDLTEKQDTAESKVETVKIQKGSLNSVIKLPGQLKPFEVVDIYPKVNGFVKEMFVDRGSMVHEGQVLMTLEAPEIDEQYQAAVSKMLQAQETVNASRDRYYRLKAAAKTPGAVSELDLVNSQSKYQADSAFGQSEKANVSAVQALKDYLVVRAPFAGVITERNVHPGTLTGPNFKQDGKPLLNLQDLTKLRLEVFIPEEYADKVDMKDKQITFSTDALPGQTFHADISRSANALSDNYRSEAIEADVNNKDNTFKPGMYVEADLKVKSQVQSFSVPATAIITSTERKYVIVLDGGKTRFVSVKEGITNNGNTEVFGDFKGDETVLKNPNNEIKEGAILKE